MTVIHYVSGYSPLLLQWCKKLSEKTTSSCTWKQDKKTQTKFRWEELACKAKGVLMLNLNLHCYWNKFNGLLQHIFCQSISVPELMFSHIAPDILGWQNIEMLVTATVTLPPASWRNSGQATTARRENWSGFLSLSGRESCVLQTPYAGSRVFQPSQGRLPLSCSILAFSWTKGSWTSMSHWSSADQCSSRAASSSWKNG